MSEQHYRRVRRIAQSLPEVKDSSDERALGLAVGGKAFAWTLLERPRPKARREPVPQVLAVRCTPADKESLLSASPEKFFSTDHYAGYPAVLVRLDLVDDAELTELLTDGWRCVAPKTLLQNWDDGTE